jgi:hypothetical protein
MTQRFINDPGRTTQTDALKGWSAVCLEGVANVIEQRSSGGDEYSYVLDYQVNAIPWQP